MKTKEPNEGLIECAILFKYSLIRLGLKDHAMRASWGTNVANAYVSKYL